MFQLDLNLSFVIIGYKGLGQYKVEIYAYTLYGVMIGITQAIRD
jgi:hypothetical protein